jgi:hypothetical protein
VVSNTRSGALTLAASRMLLPQLRVKSWGHP